MMTNRSCWASATRIGRSSHRVSEDHSQIMPPKSSRYSQPQRCLRPAKETRRPTFDFKASQSAMLRVMEKSRILTKFRRFPRLTTTLNQNRKPRVKNMSGHNLSPKRFVPELTFQQSLNVMTHSYNE